VGVHIAYVNKANALFQQLKIVRIVDLLITGVRKVNCCVEAILPYCIGPDRGHFPYPTTIYTCILVLE
jgi:hypothetical protein